MLKRLMLGLSLAAGLLLLAPAPHADASDGPWWKKWSMPKREMPTRDMPYGPATGPSGRDSVPELDPGAAGGALVLLVGGVAYIVSRRREDEELA
jgi:hypothetical protein